MSRPENFVTKRRAYKYLPGITPIACGTFETRLESVQEQASIINI